MEGRGPWLTTNTNLPDVYEIHLRADLMAPVRSSDDNGSGQHLD